MAAASASAVTTSTGVKIRVLNVYDRAAECTAQAWELAAKHALHTGRRMTVVADIDDTLITETTRSFKPIKEVCELLHRVRAAGGLVFLLTARESDAEVREFTLKQLESIGFKLKTDFDFLYLCPAHLRVSRASISRFKADVRAKVRRVLGHMITMTIGDQWSDGVQVRSATEFASLDRVILNKPFAILMLNDRTASFFVKLRALE